MPLPNPAKPGPGSPNTPSNQGFSQQWRVPSIPAGESRTFLFIRTKPLIFTDSRTEKSAISQQSSAPQSPKTPNSLPNQRNQQSNPTPVPSP